MVSILIGICVLYGEGLKGVVILVGYRVGVRKSFLEEVDWF